MIENAYGAVVGLIFMIQVEVFDSDSDNDSDDDYQATQDEDEDTGDEDEAEEDDYDEGSYVKFDDDKDVGKKKGKQSKNLLVKKGKSVCSTSLNTVQYHTHTF